MKKIKQLRLVKETVRDLVPGQLSQIHGGGGISIFTEAKPISGPGCTGTEAAPQMTTVTNRDTIQ